MKAHLRMSSLMLCVLLLALIVSAASRASFCKCTCKKNSTIIPLDDEAHHPASAKTDADSGDGNERADALVEQDRRTCNDCNRQFCLDYDLPILEDCKTENKGNQEDIFAECFQRDSAKDQAVVYTFIVLTVGLLLYAGIRPYVSKVKTPSPGQSSTRYTPLTSINQPSQAQ